MSGLEIPAFIVGLSGCIALAEKGVTIWRGIGEAHVFGSNVVEDVAKLSMEYYRFEAWTNAVDFLIISQKRPESKVTGLGALSHVFEPVASTKNAHDALLKDMAKPFETAVGQIVEIMKEVAPILKRYQTKEGSTPEEQKVRNRDKSVSSGLASVLAVVFIDQPHSTPSSAGQTKLQEQKFQRGVSFRKRFTYSTHPWKETDRHVLQKSAKKLEYWNNRLEGFFPVLLQRSLIAEAVPAKMLGGNTWEHQALHAFVEGSNLYGTEISKSASLWHSRLNLEKSTLLDSKDEAKSIDDLKRSPGQYQQAIYQRSPYQPETGVLKIGQSQGEWAVRALKFVERALKADRRYIRLHKSSHRMA